MLIVADDLTGAADAGASCLRRGLSVTVVMDAELSSASGDVIAIDACTRSMDAAEAGDMVASLVSLAPADRMLCKKVDSTLRGHLGGELAAALHARRAVLRKPVTAILAPAFPATGRTMLEGRLHVHGVPLERTELWEEGHPAHRMPLSEVLAASGLSSAPINLEAVRGPALADRLIEVAKHADVLVCDATTEADLAALAGALRHREIETLRAGSAGLIGHLADQLVPAANLSQGIASTQPGPVLFVIGSMSSLARAQAQVLAERPDVALLDVPVPLLLAGSAALRQAGWTKRLKDALNNGRDVVLLPHADLIADACHAAQLRQGLASLAASCADRIGGLFVTGGETARTVLDALSVTQFVLHREIQVGVPLATMRVRRHLGLVTKAGAFGDPATLLACRRALHDLTYAPVQLGSGKGEDGS